MRRDWTHGVRRYVAEGRAEFLREAKSACSDPRIRAWLQTLSTPPTREQAAFVLTLRAENRPREAALLEIFSLAPLALHAARPEALNPADQERTIQACHRLADLSRAHGLQECEARFRIALGVRALKRGELSAARAEFHAARAACEEGDPAFCRVLLAEVREELGILAIQEGELDEARDHFLGGIEILKALPEAESATSRGLLASTHMNLGVAHDLRGALAEAEGAYGEALKLYAPLVRKDPDRYRPARARTLLNFGITLRRQREGISRG